MQIKLVQISEEDFEVETDHDQTIEVANFLNKLGFCTITKIDLRVNQYSRASGLTSAFPAKPGQTFGFFVGQINDESVTVENIASYLAQEYNARYRELFVGFLISDNEEDF